MNTYINNSEASRRRRKAAPRAGLIELREELTRLGAAGGLRVEDDPAAARKAFVDMLARGERIQPKVLR